jgi:hypothetical protein
MHELSKGTSEMIHFKTKLRERYGFERMNRFEYRAMCRDAEVAPVVIQQSVRVSVRRVSIFGVKMLCVYDANRRRLVTVLPPEVSEPAQVYEYVWHRRPRP